MNTRRFSAWMHAACTALLGIILCTLEGESVGELDPEHIRIPIRREILARVAATNVSDTILPAAVAFIRTREREGPVALGNAIVDTNACLKGIITSSHLFHTREGEGRAYYKLLRPLGEWHPIERIDDFSAFSMTTNEFDLAFCVPGKSVLLRGFSGYKDGTRQMWVRSFWKYDAEPVRAVTSGKGVPVIGALEEGSGTTWTILLYEAIEGESGLGFLADGKKLHIVSSVLEVNPKLRTYFALPPAQRFITIAHTVRLKL